MVFGLVLGFLEGRQTTELLAAGLCASFILADGIMKSVGQNFIDCRRSMDARDWPELGVRDSAFVFRVDVDSNSSPVARR